MERLFGLSPENLTFKDGTTKLKVLMQWNQINWILFYLTTNKVWSNAIKTIIRAILDFKIGHQYMYIPYVAAFLGQNSCQNLKQGCVRNHISQKEFTYWSINKWCVVYNFASKNWVGCWNCRNTLFCLRNPVIF